MKTRIIYTWKELRQRLAHNALGLLHSLVALLWALLLIPVKLGYMGSKALARAIRLRPCTSVAVTFCFMLCLAIAIHMQMKVRLTTAEWQRDSLQQRLDSAHMVAYRYVNFDK